MAEAKSIKLTRQELYERVWFESIWKLAPKLGLSGRGLAKLCAREGIPVPKRGYWGKKAAGWEPTRPGLPDHVAESADSLTFHPSPKPTDALGDAPPLPSVAVPARLEKPHPFVAATRRALRAVRLDETGRLCAPATDGTLDFHVSPEGLDRALRIAQAVITALEVDGAAFELCDEGKHRAIVRIQGEAIPWAIEEMTERHERPLTRADRLDREQHPYRDTHKDYDVRPTGQLRLSLIEGDYSGLRRRWGDSARHSLESQLPRAVRGILDLGAYLRKQRRDREEAWKRRLEEEARREEARRRQQVYEIRHKALMGLVEVAEEASRLRTFLAATEDRLRVTDSTFDENTRRWLAWGRRHLAWLEDQAGQFPVFGDDAP